MARIGGVDYRGTAKTRVPKLEVYQGKDKIRTLSPRGRSRFGWGDDEEGGLETAWAILNDHGGEEAADALYRGFYRDIISKITGDSWGVFGWTVRRWIKEEQA